MKKLLTVIAFTLWTAGTNAQVQELAQLALNIEKLAQFKQFLSDLKKGYEIVFKGYTVIRNISEGNFSLHDAFLDGLLQISPAVKKYQRIGDIISLQLRLVKEYKTSYSMFKRNEWFTVAEIGYMGKVYNRLFIESLRNLDALATIVTARQLRMSDDERLNAIDQIFTDMQEKLVFLKHFNSSTAVLGVHRAKEQEDVELMRQLYQVNK